ncbi:MAG: hypothetical protein AAF824_02885 [Bacteroidota bacterium]
MKNFFGTILLVSGLFIMIVGWSRRDSETVTEEVNGTEIVVKNSEAENFNWRSFYGGLIAFFGFVGLVFPSQKVIDGGKFD